MSAYTFVATWLIQSTLLGLMALALPVVCRVRQPRVLTAWWSCQAVCVARSRSAVSGANPAA